MTDKILKENQPCRHCGTPVKKITRNGPPKHRNGRSYYFLWFFVCPACKAMYMVEAAKRYYGDELAAADSAPRLF